MISDSFADVIAQRNEFARALYTRLFQPDPNVAPLFREDQAAQKDNLARMTIAAVDCLDEIE